VGVRDGYDSSIDVDTIRASSTVGGLPTHAFRVGKAAPVDGDTTEFSVPVLGGRYRAKWCVTNAIAADSLKAGRHLDGRRDVG
jgi:hypothetical protein